MILMASISTAAPNCRPVAVYKAAVAFCMSLLSIHTFVLPIIRLNTSHTPIGRTPGFNGMRRRTIRESIDF